MILPIHRLHCAWRYAIDATKMNDKLNWQPDETFETGIRKTVKWYLSDSAKKR